MASPSPTAAHEALTTHPHYKYRGCAPDPDNPRRAAGNPELSLDAWTGADRDDAEPPDERQTRIEAAKTVCRRCPVLDACRRYSNTTTPDGQHLVEPLGIRGAQTALERHRTFIARRHQIAATTPATQIRTPQRQAVLTALAEHVDPAAVAAAAGVDLRTANWQRARLVTQLNLNKTRATRRQLLNAAVRRGLLDQTAVRDDDGTVPAIPR